MFVFSCSREAPKAGEPVEASVPVESASATAGASASAGAAASASSGVTLSPPATMNLLDAGQEPRRALRYKWSVDRKEQLALDLHTSASTESGGAKQPEIPLPPVHVVVAIDPKSVSPEGEMTYAWRVTAATVTASAQMPPQIADGMRTEVDAIAHLAGTGVEGANGVSRGVTIDTASAALDAGATGQMVEQVRQMLLDVAAPLPDEPIGKGARWQKLTQLDTKDARLTQTETFTLVEAHAEEGSIADQLAQTAPPQPLRAPGMQPGAQARMESMLASADVKIRFDLTHLVAQRKYDGTTSMVVSGAAPGERGRKMTMVMRVGVVVAGSVR